MRDMTDRGRGCHFINAQQGERTLTNDITVATYLLSKLPITYSIGRYVYRLVDIVAAYSKHQLVFKAFHRLLPTIFVFVGMIPLLLLRYSYTKLTAIGILRGKFVFPTNFVSENESSLLITPSARNEKISARSSEMEILRNAQNLWK